MASEKELMNFVNGDIVFIFNNEVFYHTTDILHDDSNIVYRIEDDMPYYILSIEYLFIVPMKDIEMIKKSSNKIFMILHYKDEKEQMVLGSYQKNGKIYEDNKKLLYRIVEKL